MQSRLWQETPGGWAASSAEPGVSPPLPADARVSAVSVLQVTAPANVGAESEG